jgi:Dual specificity phosphatase, catalytic domain
VRQTLRRFWPIAALALAGVIGAIVHVSVDHFTRDPPNYSKIEEGLWLGGKVGEPPPGTQAVLNLCEVEDSYPMQVGRWQPIHDGSPAPSLDWLRSQVEFIESARSAHHAVYVHCMNGASRSSMVMAAYLMRREHWSRDQALEFLRTRRSEVRPNPAFLSLLLEWEKSLNLQQRGKSGTD